MMVLNILLLCSIKFLQIIQRQIKLTSWALRGKKKKKKKIWESKPQDLRFFLVPFWWNTTISCLPYQVMLLSFSHLCHLTWFMFCVNKNMIPLSFLIGGLVGDVSHLRVFMKIADLLLKKQVMRLCKCKKNRNKSPVPTYSNVGMSVIFSFF